MKTNLTISLFLLFAFGMTLYSQEILINGRLYENAKIQSINGNTLMADFIVKGDSIKMLMRGPNNSKIELHESLHEISRIELGTRYPKYIMAGSCIGFSVGIVATILTTHFYEQPKMKLVSDETKFLIVAGSTLTGFLVGLQKKWKPIYSQDNKVLNKIDYNINYSPYRENISFNLCYKF